MRDDSEERADGAFQTRSAIQHVYRVKTKKKAPLTGQGNRGRTVQSHFRTGAIPRVTRWSKRVSISQLTWGRGNLDWIWREQPTPSLRTSVPPSLLSLSFVCLCSPHRGKKKYLTTDTDVDLRLMRTYATEANPASEAISSHTLIETNRHACTHTHRNSQRQLHMHGAHSLMRQNQRECMNGAPCFSTWHRALRRDKALMQTSPFIVWHWGQKMELASSQYRGIIILEKGGGVGGGTRHTSIPSSLTIPHCPPCGPSLPAPTNPNTLSPFRQPPSLCSLLSPSPLSKNLHFLLLIILHTDRHTVCRWMRIMVQLVKCWRSHIHSVGHLYTHSAWWKTLLFNDINVQIRAWLQHIILGSTWQLLLL